MTTASETHSTLEPSGSNGPATGQRREQMLLGLLLVAIGAVVAYANFAPNSGEAVILVIGLIVLAFFAITRWDWAMIWGSIQTGAGVGVLLVADAPNGDSGGLFLVSLGAGFLAVSVLSAVLRYADHRVWPLIPGGILVVLGGAQLIGAQDILDLIFTYGWPVALVGAGAILIGRALLAARRERN
jgi:hypothetical protein